MIIECPECGTTLQWEGNFTDFFNWRCEACNIELKIDTRPKTKAEACPHCHRGYWRSTIRVNMVMKKTFPRKIYNFKVTFGNGDTLETSAHSLVDLANFLSINTYDRHFLKIEVLNYCWHLGVTGNMDIIRILRHEWDCLYYDQGMPTLININR